MRHEAGALTVLALGSNLGDRLGLLRRAVRGLVEGGVLPDLVSSVYETPPLGLLEQPDFLNLVVAGWSGLGPGRLLALARRLEAEAGRLRTVPNGPRTLDVDLLFLGDRIVRREEVIVPHPRWKERSFVVRPLEEILPHLMDPETGLRVEEVAGLWPLAPESIRVVEGPEAVRDDRRKGAP